MTRPEQPTTNTRQNPSMQTRWPVAELPFGRRNAYILAAGIATLLLGYSALAQPPVDGWLGRDLAPVLLVLGYAVLLPLGLVLPPKH